MKKKKKDNKIKEKEVVRTPLGEAVHAFPWRLLLILLGNTVVIFGIYRVAIYMRYFEIVLIAYMIITAGLAGAYVIYNRGFSRRGITPDMLPDTMTDEEKAEFIGDGERRLKKSKWMLTLIFPFLVTFLYELLELFVFDYIKQLFG